MKELGDYLFEYFMDEFEQGRPEKIKEAFETYDTYKKMCERRLIPYDKFKYSLAKEYLLKIEKMEG